jgi:hypothetical protein
VTQIEQMLSGPWAVRLGWTLMHSLWEIAAVAAVVAALLALLRRRSAEVRYLAACVGLAAMLVPPAVTYFLIPTPPDAVVGTQPGPVKPATGTVATEAAPGPGGSSRSPAVGLPGPGLVFMAAETSDAAPSDTPPAASPGLPLPEAASGIASRWVPWLAACWILGVLVLSVRNLGGWFAAWRLRRFGTMPMPEAWLRRFSELKTRLGVGLPVRLVQSVLVEVPVVVGWLRPVILMPVGILTGFSPHEIEAMLAHELSHIRRYDCLVNLFQTVAETLLFYHPAAWWLSRRIRIEREHCCDDAAVRVCGSRPLYARALVSLAARSAVPHPALSARGGSLVGRVRRILGLPDQGGCPAAWLAGAAVLVGLTIVGASLLAPAEAGESSEPAETAASADADAAPAETREAESGLQLRLTATADKEYKRRYTLPLLLELKNTSKRRLSPALRMTSRLKAETTDGEGKPLRVADLIELTPWEQRDTANTLPPGATIRWTTAFDRLAFIDRPAAGSKVRLRFQLEDRSLPGRVESNWIELTMRDAPPLVSGQGDFPGVWAQFVDFVYREPTGAGYHALHVDGEGHAELIAYSAGEDPWYGRHSATMSRKRLDFLADVLKRQEAWKLVGLKPKAARPEDPHVEFAYVAAGSLLRCRFPMEQVKEEPALLAIHRAAEFLMACVVQDARAAERDWGPLSGDEDDGLQCRLRATKEVWQPGETPAFEADVRNVGMRDLLAARSEVVFEVEVDGKWCRYTAPSSAKSSPLPPGREYDGIAITLGSHWREKSTLQPIPWAPGKHTVRVAFVAWAGGEEPSARAQSNPVTITIVGQQAIQEPQPPAGARVTLLLDRPEFLLGENITVCYRLENAGREPLRYEKGGHYPTLRRNDGYAITMTPIDAEGKEIGKPLEPVPEPISHGGPVGHWELKPGEVYQQTLYLPRYVRLDQPGRYRLRIVNRDRLSQFIDRGRPSAAPIFSAGETTITLRVPTPQEAREVYERMKKLPQGPVAGIGERRDAPIADFEALIHPVYLPILRERALAGDRESLLGLGKMWTPEANAAVIDVIEGALAKDDLDLALAAYHQVCGMPDPRWYPGFYPDAKAHETPEAAAKREFVARTWRPQFALTLRRLAGRLARDPKSVGLEEIGRICESVGAAADMPELALAYSKSIATTKTLPFETQQYFRPRGSAYIYRFAARELIKRGAQVSRNPQTPGEAAVYLIAMRERKEFRPEDWPEQVVRWLRHETPYMRELVLEHMPEPIPEAALQEIPKLLADDYVDLQIAACHTARKHPREAFRQPLLEILRKGKEEHLLSAATEAAAANGVTKDLVVERKEPGPAVLDLEARVVGPDGKPVPASQITFWKLADAAAEKEAVDQASRTGSDVPHLWRDQAGKTWVPIHHFSASDRTTKTGLVPGEYRATAFIDRDEPSIGASEPVLLDTSRQATTVTIPIPSGPSLELEMVDAATGKPVEHTQVRLIRPDGLPVLAGNSGNWYLYRQDHRCTFHNLISGEYTLFVRRNVSYAGDPKYIAEGEPLKFEVKEGENRRVAVRLKAIPLDEKEIAKRWPWVVTGKVTDQSGNGLPGVTVRANCGWGTLRPTGETVTASDGTYTLRFGPGMRVLDEKTEKWRAGVQAAVVSPWKPGYYERNLHRQGDLLMADEVPDQNGLKVWSARPERIVVPEKPHRVDFVMLPAASIEVQLIDEKDQPLADTQLWIAGRTLPPASSVLASGRTDKAGKIGFGKIPLEYAWWLAVHQPGNPRDEVRTLPTVFRKAAQYKLKLRLVQDGSGPWRLEIAGVADAKNRGVRDDSILVDPARIFMAALTDPGVERPANAKTIDQYSDALREVLDLARAAAIFDKEGYVWDMTLCAGWVNDDVMREFQRLPRLESLALNGAAEIGDEGLAHLGRLTELKHLSLPTSKVTDKGLAHLVNLKRLESLRLWSGRITDEGLKTISGIEGLKGLTLFGASNVTEAGLQHLAGMKHLNFLHIADATLSPAAIDRLKQALPRCQVFVTPTGGR